MSAIGKYTQTKSGSLISPFDPHTHRLGAVQRPIQKYPRVKSNFSWRLQAQFRRTKLAALGAEPVIVRDQFNARFVRTAPVHAS